MKALSLILGLLLTALPLQAQKDFETTSIKLLPESDLVIAGSTNVNTFECVFDISLISHRTQVKFSNEGRFLFFKDLVLPLKTRGFDCGNKRMNSDFQDLLLCDEYPEIRIRINKAEFFHGDYTKAFITVELAGHKKDYELPVLVSKEHFQGKFQMNIRDFGLEPPKKALGLIEVDEKIEVRFNLALDY